jgi:hypothetical protein
MMIDTTARATFRTPGTRHPIQAAGTSHLLPPDNTPQRHHTLPRRTPGWRPSDGFNVRSARLDDSIDEQHIDHKRHICSSLFKVDNRFAAVHRLSNTSAITPSHTEPRRR